jgi:hypothetical protein
VGSDIDACIYIHDLEDCLRQVLVEATSATVSQAVVLLVRGALARGDLTETMQYAQAVQGLLINPTCPPRQPSAGPDQPRLCAA